MQYPNFGGRPMSAAEMMPVPRFKPSPRIGYQCTPPSVPVYDINNLTLFTREFYENLSVYNALCGGTVHPTLLDLSTNYEYYGGVYQLRPAAPYDAAKRLDIQRLSSRWYTTKFPSVEDACRHWNDMPVQRCPFVTVDTLNVFMTSTMEEPEIILGEWGGKTNPRGPNPRDALGPSYRGLVLPSGGHVENAGYRGEYFEKGHTTVDEAAAVELCEELGIAKNEMVMRRKLAFRDGAAQDPKAHCIRFVFFSWISEKPPQATAEIKKVHFVKLSNLPSVLEMGIQPKNDYHIRSYEPLEWVLGHDQLVRDIMALPTTRALINMVVQASRESPQERKMPNSMTSCMREMSIDREHRPSIQQKLAFNTATTRSV